ncbi:hypothetical protein E3N88_24234 [Mikania micrantha]|uniref:DNA2/NAM7 helicase-like C-terminal domain-containing protein n=1 Tax=Mikania micrantha TaxID=192012 RepID=A0A5N6NHB4_9ASTR|nr:hypothetical protein E3N88_24234 [Mikania micrantha]
MPPSISQFPNREFYDKSILDGVDVKSKTYGKHFLDGDITKNVMEVAVAGKIVANVFKEVVARKQRVSVDCISPYKAQVNAMQETIGMKYTGPLYGMKDGWGLATDGKILFGSDGSSSLYHLNSQTMKD